MTEERSEESRLFALDPSHGPIIITGNSVKIEIPAPIHSSRDGYEPNGANRYISPDERVVTSVTIRDIDLPSVTTCDRPVDGICAIKIYIELLGGAEKNITIEYMTPYATITFDSTVYSYGGVIGDHHTHYNRDAIIKRVEITHATTGRVITYSAPPDGRCRIMVQDDHLYV